jgi:hypothetical protein
VCQGDFQLVNDIHAQVLLDHIGSTRDTNITTACGFPSQLKGNAAGLAAVNAATRNSIFVGARQFTGDTGLGSQGTFGFTYSDLSDTQLILTVAPSAVPEPGSLTLLGLALAATGF